MSALQFYFLVGFSDTFYVLTKVFTKLVNTWYESVEDKLQTCVKKASTASWLSLLNQVVLLTPRLCIHGCLHMHKGSQELIRSLG